MTQNFFGYGAFAEGEVHFSKFSQFIVGQEKALVKGQAYRLHCGYPILNVKEEFDWIEGVLYKLDIPENFWPVVDGCIDVHSTHPEKSLFNRVDVLCMDLKGSEVKAIAYVLNPKKVGLTQKKIARGEWEKEMKAEPPILESLQDRHREYISRLSRSKGRDIVPIKLDLYRELMSMELIVDKGRRLALSPLGKEVSHFIQ